MDRDFDNNFSWFFKLKPLASTKQEKGFFTLQKFKKMTFYCINTLIFIQIRDYKIICLRQIEANVHKTNFPSHNQ